jgi:HSP20 family protein
MAQVRLQGGSNSERAWEWLVSGWHALRDKAARAITYFAPDDEEQAGQRWGVLASDVVEQKATVEVELELPGMAKADLSVEVINDHLVVSGNRKTSDVRRQGALVITERAFGEFKRIIRLPCAVDAGGTKATYQDGILQVTLPKHASLVARSIPVSSG